MPDEWIKEVMCPLCDGVLPYIASKATSKERSQMRICDALCCTKAFIATGATFDDDEKYQRALEEFEARIFADRDRKVKMVFDGLVFVYPFVCLCCGAQITARQWSWGRACGWCDCGKCKCHLNLFDGSEPGKIRPHVLRFIDGEAVQIDVEDMMRLRRANRGRGR
jgi:hypothetical protein